MRLFFALLCTISPVGMGSGGAPPGVCERPLPSAPQGLPTRVIVETQCGTYAIDHDGSVALAPRHPVDPGPWQLDLRQGHLVLIANRRVVWRSRRNFARQLEGIQSLAVGRGALAFSFDDRRLWVARFRGVEHVVARGEAAFGWSRAGRLLTVKWSRRSPYLGTAFTRGPNGGNRRHLASRVTGVAFEDTTKTLVFATADNRLARTDGKVVKRLASLVGYGLKGRELWPILIGGRLIAFQGNGRVVVFRPDGALFATSTFARDVLWTSELVAGSRGVAFTIGDADGRHETLYLLRAGDRSAKVLYRAPAYIDGCRWAAAQWHGDWILYSTSQGQVTAVDATETNAPIDLKETIAHLPGVERQPDTGTLGGFDGATWS
ncbi:MAG: hypothetical protein M3R70_08245 [Actinomycetota bacterium]|nr:hypothetical protein [Actinomycetota bacterium]